jgi:hypothetical protein
MSIWSLRLKFLMEHLYRHVRRLFLILYIPKIKTKTKLHILTRSPCFGEYYLWWHETKLKAELTLTLSSYHILRKKKLKASKAISGET